MKWLILIFSFLWMTASYADPYSFSYSGRLADASGEPYQGPIDLQVKFFRVATGGSEIGPALPFVNTKLVQGVFQINIALTSSERAEVFDGNKDVFVEVTDTTNGRTFPRQKMGAMAYALRVPVDNSTLSWNSDGELTVSETVSVTKLDGTKVDASGAAHGQILTWNSSTKTWEPTSIGPGNITDESITKDQIAPDSIGVSELDDGLCTNTQILKKSGGTWACATDSGAGTSISDGGDTYAQNIDIGPTDAFDLNFLTDSAGAGGVRMTIDATGNVGIGTTYPSSKLSILGETGNEANISQTIVGNSGWPTLLLRRAQGTVGAPTSLADGETIGSVSYAVYDGGDYKTAASIRAYSESAASASNVSAGLAFITSPPGGTSFFERMRIDSAGNVGIGTTNPIDRLTVGGSDARIRLQDDDDPSGLSRLQITDVSDAQVNIAKYRNTPGNVNFDINPEPLDGTGDANVRLFRSTDTSGVKRMQFFKGDNTTTVDAQIGVDGTDTWFSGGGNVGIGSTAPASALDIVGTTGIRAHQICDEDGLACKDISDGWDAAATGVNTDISSLTGISDGGAVGRAGSLLTFDSTNGDISTSQGFGIGTSDPQSALHVSGPDADIALGTGDTNVTSILSNGNRAASRGALYFNHDSNQAYNHLYLGSAFELVDGVSGAAPTFERAGSNTVDPSILKIGENGFQFLQGTEGVVGTAFTPSVSMVVDRLGNVGLGTSNPTLGKLQVYETKDGLLDAAVLNDSSGANAMARLLVHNGGSVLALEKSGLSFAGTGARQAGFGSIVDSGAGLNLAASGAGSPTLRLYTGGIAAGNERMRIDASGNVGIGTTVPTQKLEVASEATLAAMVTTSYSSASANDSGMWFSQRARGIASAPEAVDQDDRLGVLSFYGHDGTSFHQSTANAAIIAYAAENFTPTAQGTALALGTTAVGSAVRTERIRIAPDGNVGIGTTTPAARLHILDTGGTYLALDATGTGGTDSATIHLLTKGDGSQLLNNATTKGWSLSGRGDAWSSVDVQNDLNLSYWDGVAFSSYFTVDSLTGNVGIGTNNPSQKLHLNGNMRMGSVAAGVEEEADFTITSGGQIIIKANDSTTGDVNYSGLVLQAGSAGGAQGQIVMSTLDAEAMRIDSFGNVGIGTTNPTSKLHVGGVAGTDGIRYPDGTLQTSAVPSGSVTGGCSDYGTSWGTATSCAMNAYVVCSAGNTARTYSWCDATSCRWNASFGGRPNGICTKD